VIASYYLGTMLDNAGITNTTTQLQIVGALTINISLARLTRSLECHSQRLVPGRLHCRHTLGRQMGP